MGVCSVGCAVVLLVAWVGSVSAQKKSCRPQIWNPGAGVLTGRGSCAVGRAAASVVVAAAVDRAQDVCASVTMPAVSATKASSVEVSVAVNVECVIVKPTARAEHASAVGTLMAV